MTDWTKPLRKDQLERLQRLREKIRMESDTLESWRYGGWQRTPIWHPRRWLGYAWRQWVWEDGPMVPGDGFYDGEWQYQTHEQRARQILEEAYAR